MASASTPAAAGLPTPFKDLGENRSPLSERKRGMVYLVFAAIWRTSMKIAAPLSRRLAKLCAVLLPRLWDWVRAIRRIHKSYHDGHGFYPSLLFPVRYTEKMQWRKLFDLNPLYAVLCDKIAVREVVAQRIGPEFLVPLLWVGRS